MATTDDTDPRDEAGGDGILSPLVGHDGAKAIIRSALRRGDVDILLSGAPASGKSVVLLAIEEAVPGAKYVDARGVSERKLRDILSEDPPILLLDEIDNMDPDPFTALNTAMEQGRVTKAVTGDEYDVEISTQFFGATNAMEPIPDDVADRFVSVEFDPYTRDEFVEVCERLLPEQVGWVGEHDSPRDAAGQIARTVWDQTQSNSPRTARDAARLADSPGRVEAIVAAMNDPKADVTSDPIRPDEIAATQRDDTDAGGDIKTLADIRDDMADPDEFGQRDAGEITEMFGERDASDVEGMFDDEGGDDDGDSPLEQANTGSEATEPGDATAADDDDSTGEGETLDFYDGYNDEHLQKARQYIEQVHDAGEEVVSNEARDIAFEILVPRNRTDEVKALIGEHQLTPTAPTIFTQQPLFYEEADGEFAHGLGSFQFVYDERDNMASTGYDLEAIVEGLEQSDVKVLYTASGAIQDMPL